MLVQQVMEERAEGSANAPVTMSDLTLLLFGHAAFQYLHAGSALGVFRFLAERGEPVSDQELRVHTGLEAHPLRCLLFGLTSLGLVLKSGTYYSNAPLVTDMIGAGTWTVVEDTIALEAEIVYVGQTDFVEALRENSNVGLRRIPGTGRDLYHRLAENADLQRVFYRYMSSWSRMACSFLLRDVPFARWSHIVDVGGGDGTTAIAIAHANPKARVTLLDLPGNGALARARAAHAGVGDRVAVAEGDMFAEPFPAGADCFLFMHQLVIWPLETVRQLLEKSYEALRPGGAVVICSSISNDARDGPVMAALDSVYFISIPATRGMIYSWSDYDAALRDVGFTRIERYPFGNWTPHGAIVAVKDAGDRRRAGASDGV